MATILFCLALISLFSLSLSAANAITEELPAMPVQSLLLSDANGQSSLQTYIVHVSKPKSTFLSARSEVDVEKWYESFLPVSSVDSNQEQRRMIYSYKSVVSGFAAKLTADEVKAMEKKDGFVLAMPERVLTTQTTHTPNFLGLHKEVGLWKNSNFGKGVIIGLLDTGVTPNHPSFSDQGMPPPPAKWKGKCEFNGTVCNNKLIGARAFQGGTTPAPPLDEEGHGTHTASTAGGSFVKDANALGNANGTASGMAPNAHVAMYKVCSEAGCSESDILAAMEAAIEDGVDVLSLSLGGSSTPFYADSIALGAFAAIQKGVFVSCSAGNSGPVHSTLSNEAPWILTVGASTVDRSIRAAAFLGDKVLWDGESLYQPTDFPDTLLPLIYAGANKNGSASSALCGPGSLKGLDVKGKVVLCERGGGIARIAKGQEVKDAGGAAMILMNQKLDGDSTLADAHVLPATHVGNKAGVYIKNYINKTAKPMATIIFRGTVIGGQSAPQVTSFSSRGPSLASPGILKPDIIGPGVSILAAWPFPLTNNTNSKSTFNMISGTSMSCPHLSGIAALIKSAHPDWSPAAIKSAIMTSADLMDLKSKPITDETEKPADFFAIGAGHVNPPKASDPGLVYDAQPDDYLPYLCGLNYTDAQVSTILQRPVKCSNVSSIPEAQLNYPSFSITLGPTQTLTRTVTNVGPAKSSYTYKLLLPPGVSAALSPAQLDFSAVNQKLTFTVKFSGKGPINTFAQGYLTWSSAQHTVRSPVSVLFQ